MSLTLFLPRKPSLSLSHQIISGLRISSMMNRTACLTTGILRYCTKYSSPWALNISPPFLFFCGQDPRQFWTLFPHTPDNSFLGFVVEPIAMAAGTTKKNQGVIYGKESTWHSRLTPPPFFLLPSSFFLLLDIISAK